MGEGVIRKVKPLINNMSTGWEIAATKKFYQLKTMNHLMSKLAHDKENDQDSDDDSIEQHDDAPVDKTFHFYSDLSEVKKVF